MGKAAQHSDYANTDDPYAGQVEVRKPKPRPLFYIDERGWVVGGTWLPPEEGSGKEFMAAMQRLREKYPFDRDEIVWPEGWECDADGRGLTVMEMDYLRATREENAA